MSNEDFKSIAAFLEANPGAIASEIGVSPVIMNRLEKEGRIIRIGQRSTGQRGRPPVEWALPGTEGVVNDERVTEAVEKAKIKVAAHDEYWAVANQMWHLREQLGWKQAEQHEAYITLKAERDALKVKHAATGGAPPTPTVTDLVLAGRIEAPLTKGEDEGED